MGMISIKELSVEAETSVLNENGEFSMAIPSFKNFSRKTKKCGVCSIMTRNSRTKS
jgi:hypothetical protein